MESIPELSQYGAYSSAKTYTKSQVKDLIIYAKVRGVHIIPEFDAPAHVGNGWQFTERNLTQFGGKIVLCLEKEHWMSYCQEPPCGQVSSH